MSTWWVNHKQTHKQEISGGYLWSPKKDKNGARNESYLNMTRTKQGETIFSYANGAIRAVGRIAGACTDAQRPAEFRDTGEQWSKDGWRVPVDWSILSNPLRPRDHLSEILPLLPEKYSPLHTTKGTGNQKLYLTEANEALAEVLLTLIRQNNHTLEL